MKLVSLLLAFAFAGCTPLGIGSQLTPPYATPTPPSFGCAPGCAFVFRNAAAVQIYSNFKDDFPPGKCPWAMVYNSYPVAIQAGAIAPPQPDVIVYRLHCASQAPWHVTYYANAADPATYCTFIGRGVWAGAVRYAAFSAKNGAKTKCYPSYNAKVKLEYFTYAVAP